MVIDTSAIVAIVLNEPDAYALALTRGEPLLFKGEDFAKTDVNLSSEALLR